MLNDITLGQYFPGNSFIHQLDPRSKILLTVVYISSIFMAESYGAYGILGVAAAGFVLVSGIPAKMVLRSVKPLWMIILLTVLIHFFATPGTVVFNVGSFSITEEGLRQGVMMSTRLVFLIVVSSLLTFTTSPIALTDGIERLLHPFARFGVPAHELAMMMTIALRFIPTLLEETDRIMKAQMARGADFASGNILKRAKSMVPLLVPLFISAFRRADELATAMEARCYQGGKNRTRMKELRMTSRDGIAFGMMAVLLGILIVFRVTAW